MFRRKRLVALKAILLANKGTIIFLLLFLSNIFLRFYEIGSRNPFGWDQVDNAWAAKEIIVDHKFPLLGMQAKLNSGIYIGPYYYYLISIFYSLTDLDPIASGIFSGLTSIFTILVLFFISKKIFSENIALITVFLYVFCFPIIIADRIQWPVNLITAVSLIIFYSLYNVLIGRVKYLIILAIALGFSFHLHFTFIFYPLIIILCLPFFKWRRILKYLLPSFVLLFIFLLPTLVADTRMKGTLMGNLSSYREIYYHGFHLVRVIQLAKDAFIQFEEFLVGTGDLRELIKQLKYILVPLFSFIYLINKPSKERLILIYLVWLWFLVPWFVFSLYRGEISNYYFYLNRPIVILILAYLTWFLLHARNFFLKTAITIYWFYFLIVNIQDFSRAKDRGVDFYKKQVREAISKGEVISFTQGDPRSYLYYILIQRKK